MAQYITDYNLFRKILMAQYIKDYNSFKMILIAQYIADYKKMPFQKWQTEIKHKEVSSSIFNFRRSKERPYRNPY